MLPSSFKLSLCIATFNRAPFLRATLNAIVSQATVDCEIVVSDNASTDNTEQVVLECAQRFDRLRYIKQDVNRGFDRNFDYVVQHARGEYCWLMSDDDLLKPDAVATVLGALRREICLVMVNYERLDFSLSNILLSRFVEMDSHRLYGSADMDRMFVDTAHLLMFVGCIVIKRDTWLARERERYYGSMFIHVAVIFQKPLPGDALLIAEPLVSYRQGNAGSLSSTVFELLMIKWPSLVWSLAPSESAKKAVCRAEPWRNLRSLLRYRALGWYSVTDYDQWIRPHLRSHWQLLAPALIAILPGVLLNTATALYCALGRSRHRRILLNYLKGSPFYLTNWSLRRQNR